MSATNTKKNLCFGLILILCACAKTENEDSDTESPDGDDTLVADAVPMALLATNYLTEMGGYLGATKTSGGAAIEQTRAFKADESGADAPYAVATSILGASGHAANDMQGLLTDVQALLATIFGTDGYFRGLPVVMPPGKKERLFTRVGADPNDPAAAGYLIVKVHEEGSDYKFSVDVYRPKAEIYERETEINFTPSDDQTNVRVDLTHVSQVADQSQRIEARYDTAARTIDTTFGYEAPAANVPIKTVMRLDHDTDGNAVNVRGAYAWRTLGGAVSERLPRYYTVQTNDMELFTLFTRLDGQGAGAQRTAFVAAEARSDVPVLPGMDVFEKHAYSRHMEEFLVHLIRTPTLNGDCANTGHTFRAAYTAQEPPKTPPPSLAGAPANLCQSNKQVSDTKVANLIGEACRAGVDIAISMRKNDTTNLTQPLGLCRLRFEQSLLTNPQFFRKDGDERVILQGASPSADHQQVLKKLDEAGFIDLSGLSNLDWEPLPTRSAVEFSEAEARP